MIFNADSILGNGSVYVKGANGIYHGLGSGQWIGTGGSGGGFCLMISKEKDCSGGDISVNIAGGSCVWGGSIHSGNRWCTDCSYDILV